MKIIVISVIFILTLICNSEVAPSIFAYVTTPNGSDHHNLMVVVPKKGGAEKKGSPDDGISTCYEVEDDGKLKELWKVPFYAPMGHLCLHQDGRSLLKLHKIDDDKPTKMEFGGEIALSFYVDGVFVKSITAAELVSDLSYLMRVGAYYYCVRDVYSSSSMSMEDMGFNDEDEKVKNELKRVPIFRIATVDKNYVYFTSKGRFISRVKMKEND